MEKVLYEKLRKMFDNSSILVTGGTGSFGKAFIRYIMKNFKPARLIVFSRDELKQFEMREEFPESVKSPIRYFIGDVRDKSRLYRAFDGVDYVIHAAAIKQVPAAEYNPLEAIKTNINGAVNVIDASIDNNVKKVIALSTDKACNPVNLYGATKLCSDKLFSAARSYSGKHKTQFGVVRYGNVLGSRASVIPFFMERRKTGTLPITDMNMTRFWISLEQSVEFVLKSLVRMKGGEIFVPRIPSMRVIDLARAICPDCKLEVVGIRPGEKLHEMLISEDDARCTLKFKDYYIILPYDIMHLGKNKYKGYKLCPEGFNYRSDTNSEWLSVAELRKLIKNTLGYGL